MKSEKLTILAIDDHQDNLITLKAILTDVLPNAVLLTALDGPQGLETARSENPDVILRDIAYSPWIAVPRLFWQSP